MERQKKHIKKTKTEEKKMRRAGSYGKIDKNGHDEGEREMMDRYRRHLKKEKNKRWSVKKKMTDEDRQMDLWTE